MLRLTAGSETAHILEPGRCHVTEDTHAAQIVPILVNSPHDKIWVCRMFIRVLSNRTRRNTQKVLVLKVHKDMNSWTDNFM